MLGNATLEAVMVEVDDAPVAEQIGYSGTQTAHVVGISYRQLDYWARTDLIRPSLTDATGSGSRRCYSYSDLLELKAIKKLLDAGIKLEQVRKVFTYLREHVGTDIAAAHIVIDGNSVVLCDGDHLVDALKNGQGVLNVLSLGGVKEELEADLAPFKTDAEPTESSLPKRLIS
jgi:DNA-binding transcriptional MerR regulator